jgi:hypothetical protein
VNRARASDLLGALVGAIAPALADAMLTELAKREASATDPWLPHTAWPWTRRRSVALARAGALDVRRDGRTYFARRSTIDRYMDSQRVERKPVSTQVNEAPSNDVDTLLGELGLAKRAGGKR